MSETTNVLSSPVGETPVINEVPSSPVIPNPSPVSEENNSPAPEIKFDMNYMARLTTVEKSIKQRLAKVKSELEDHYALMLKVGLSIIEENPALSPIIRQLIDVPDNNGEASKKRGRPTGSTNKKS